MSAFVFRPTGDASDPLKEYREFAAGIVGKQGVAPVPRPTPQNVPATDGVKRTSREQDIFC